MDTLQLLRAAGAKAMELKGAGGDAKGWRTREGISILRDMKVRCPWCLERVATGRIWMIDTNGRKLIRVWDKFGQQINSMWAHPHILGGSKKICLGESGDSISALTEGLNPVSAYWQVSLFMKHIGHICRGVREDNVSLGGVSWRLSSEPPPEVGREEEKCFYCKVRGKIRRSKLGGNTGTGPVCDGCWELRHVECDDCQEDEFVGLKDGFFRNRVVTIGSWANLCRGCVEKNFFRCTRCGQLQRIAIKVSGRDKCVPCQNREDRDED